MDEAEPSEEDDDDPGLTYEMDPNFFSDQNFAHNLELVYDTVWNNEACLLDNLGWMYLYFFTLF